MGHTTQINSPQKSNNLSGIVAVGGGYGNYSVFLDNAGNIYTCGNNKDGQLELGHTNQTLTFQRSESIAKLQHHKGRANTNNQAGHKAAQWDETEMFKSIEKQQNK